MSDRPLVVEQYRTADNLRARIALHERFSTNETPYPQWVFDGYDFGDDADVLEVGCGDAMMWRENRERIPDRWQLTLTDLSAAMVDEARRVLGDRAAYAVADVEALPFDDESFDAVIANHMLFHVDDRRRALGELARVFRAGGAFRGTAIGRGHLRELRELAPPAPDSQWAKTRERFTAETVTEELAPFFVDVELEPWPSSLEVTELEPLLAFVRSRGDVTEEQLAAVERAARPEIEAHGAFHVTQDTVRVRARKP